MADLRSPALQTETMHTQVLVIGAGAAGIRAALSACQGGAEVTIISKSCVTESGSSFSSISGGWGLQALMGDERRDESLEIFYDDILRAGLGCCDPVLARILVEESGQRLEELLSCGLVLRKDEQGEPLRVKGCFSDHPRAYLGEDMNNIRQTFRKMLRASRAKIMIGCAAELMVHEGICLGAWVVTAAGKLVQIISGATVLATGGGAGLFEDSLAAGTGDGYGLAHMAGADMKNLEFIQFMLGLKINGSRTFLPLSQLQSYGTLRDEEDQDLLTKIMTAPDRKRAVEERVKHHPFSTRDSSCWIDIELARARRRGTIFWQNSDSKDQPCEAVHLAQAFNGGVLIDRKAETTVSGLFAAGEVAAGPHGADRIGGCMMTATQVFGEKAGRFAAACAIHKGAAHFVKMSRELPEWLLKWEPSADFTSRSMGSARRTFSREAMVLRERRGLEQCLREIEEAKRDLRSERGGSALSRIVAEHSLMAMERIAKASIQRQESLGPHFREDACPHPSPPSGNATSPDQ